MFAQPTNDDVGIDAQELFSSRQSMTTRPIASRRVNDEFLKRSFSLGDTLHEVHQYWLSKATWARLPGRQDISPSEIPRLLPKIGLVDVLRADGCFRYRLVGTSMAGTLESDPTGKLVADTQDPSPFALLDQAAFVECAFQRRVVYSRRRVLRREGFALRFDRLVLPLAGADGGVEMLLLAQDYDWAEDAGGPAPDMSVDLFMPCPASAIVRIDEEIRYVACSTKTACASTA